jgi:diacylglycerol O-acyltransferase / wax synthase
VAQAAGISERDLHVLRVREGARLPGPAAAAEAEGRQEVTRMDRLTAEDQRMLWPDENWPQDIGALAILDGRSLLEPGGRLRIEAVREVIAARLHLVPRFRQLIDVPPPGLGGPLWVDAPAFDLHDHIRAVPLPDPADEAALLHAVERQRQHRLDRSRPLWEMCFLPGLAGGRVGLYVRMHHAIADAGAGVAILGALLATVPGAPIPAPPAWTPSPPPTARALLADNLRHLAGELRAAAAALARPVATARRVRAAWPAIREIVARKP